MRDCWKMQGAAGCSGAVSLVPGAQLSGHVGEDVSLGVFKESLDVVLRDMVSG